MKRLIVGLAVVTVGVGGFLTGPAPAQAATVNVVFTCDGSRLSASASPGDLIKVTISSACDPSYGVGVQDAVLQDAPGPGYDMVVRSTAPTGTTRDAMWVIPQAGQTLPAQAKQVLDLNIDGGASSTPTPPAPAVTPSQVTVEVGEGVCKNKVEKFPYAASNANPTDPATISVLINDKVADTFVVPPGQSHKGVAEIRQKKFSVFSIAFQMEGQVVGSPIRDYAQNCLHPTLLSVSRFIVTGKFKVGSTVRVDPGRYKPTATSVTYQWYWKILGHSKPIPGATRSSYRLRPTDRGRWVYCGVTPHRPGYFSEGYTGTAERLVR